MGQEEGLETVNNLVTFFGNGDNGTRLVGIGLTDDVIKHLKRAGGILQEADRTGQNVDVVVMYAPTLKDLMQHIDDVIPKDRREERFI